jgi:branched-chain amino acid transport system substrate-binding protein
MLAMEKSKSTVSNTFKKSVMDVANAPGEKIYPGELGKALKLIKAGKEIDYVGATALELVGSGESSGSFAEILIDNEKTNKVSYR